MTVTIYHAAQGFDASREAVPITSLPSVDVVPKAGATVVDAIELGGGYGFNSFALVTPEIALDVRQGESWTVAAVANLAGLRPDGSLYFQGEHFVLWVDFVRAAQAGVFQGQTDQVVFYDYGTAGGTFFETVNDVVQFIADWGGAAGTITAVTAYSRAFPQRRREKIAQHWRENGVIPPKVRIYAARQQQHSPEIFGKYFGFSADEAKFVLADLGYHEDADRLWRV